MQKEDQGSEQDMGTQSRKGHGNINAPGKRCYLKFSPNPSLTKKVEPGPFDATEVLVYPKNDRTKNGDFY